MKTLLNSELPDKKSITLLFFTGFFVRLIPELLALPNPIGFDTIYYAVIIKDGLVWPNWSSLFTSSWLFPAISISLYRVFGGDPFVLLKVLAPALFGLNVAGVFWFARKMLGWSVRVGLLAGLFFAFQLASLRISWDLLRNTLGLGILLFTLPFIKRLDSRRGFACFVLLSLLSVFAHEYAAATLSIIVLSAVFGVFIKNRCLTAECKRLLLGFSPALAFFLAGIYLRIFPVHYMVESSVINVGDAVNPRPFGLFFLVDYLNVRSKVDFYASYWDLFLSVVVLFCVLFLPYLFLVWKGFFKHEVLSVWTGLLLAGAFGCLVVPFCALEYWHRWMFMLGYPFTFYAVNGLKRFVGSYDGGNLSLGMAISHRKVKGMVLATVLLGSVYLATPVSMIAAGFSVGSLPVVYPYFSTSPTVPYEDVDSVVEAMKWLDGYMDADSCVVLQHAFLWWGKLYLGNDHVIVHFENDVDLAIDVAFGHGFSHVFFVWWNQPIGWYGIGVPGCFVCFRDFGRLSVYEFVG